MSERIAFAEHFIQTHSQNAARVMEELSAEVVGSFIEAIPDSISLSVLTSMLPYHAAKCLETIPRDTAAKYLAQLNPKQAASILRQSIEATRTELIHSLPRLQASRLSRLLSYPRTLVGAWMDPVILSLRVETRVGEAKKRIFTEKYDYRIIFTVDIDNRVVGSVFLVELLKFSKDQASINDITQSTVNPIFASTTLDRAINADGWSDSDVLPVIDREEKLVGVLRFADLREALNRPSPDVHASTDSNNLLGITEFCCLRLADLIVTTLAKEKVQI